MSKKRYEDLIEQWAFNEYSTRRLEKEYLAAKKILADVEAWSKIGAVRYLNTRYYTGSELTLLRSYVEGLKKYLLSQYERKIEGFA